MDSNEDEGVRPRKPVRFSSADEEGLFEKGSLNCSEGNSTGTTVSDENTFRAPKTSGGSSSVISDSQSRQGPLSNVNQDNVRLTISPGTNATAFKRDAKLRKLEQLKHQREANRARKSGVPSTTHAIDLSATERSFIESRSKEDARLSKVKFAYVAPEPKFPDISTIRPTDTTFSLKTPLRAGKNIVCSTPLCRVTPFVDVPAAVMKSSESDASVSRTPYQHATVSSTIKEMVLASDQDYFMTKDERADRQLEAMSVWCNMILRSQYEDEEFDMGSSKQEANKVLQELLTKSKIGKIASSYGNKPFKYADFLRNKKRDDTRDKARRMMEFSDIPDKIREAVRDRVISVRADCSVYSDIALQTVLLRLFFSFHPAWLHIGLETVFKTTIDVGEGESFAQVISRFIVQRLFVDPKIMKNKKYAIGCGKPIVTDAGREALHSHFLLHTALFCYFVEKAKGVALIKHNPRMFAKGSAFKSMEDVFAELSREVLSGTGASLNKVFAKIGFKPEFKQGFADDYNFSVKTFADLTDGVILSKLIELVTGSEPGSIVSRLRNPCGDRLRKIGNVKTCLQLAVERGVNVEDIKPESVVAGNKDTLLEVLWKLVGVYVRVDDERTLRRASLIISISENGTDKGSVPKDASGEKIVLHLCNQIGIQLGIRVNSLNDLLDGRVLAGAWRIYNVTAPDIRLYPGDSLLLKVANAAASDLDVPFGLHHSIGLFSVLFLSRLFHLREIHDAAVMIQRAYRSYRFFKGLKQLMSNIDSGTTSLTDNESRHAETYVVNKTGAEVEESSAEDVDRLKSVLSRIRTKVDEGVQASEEERERCAKEAIFTASVVKLQAIIRGILARRRYYAMIEKKKVQERERRKTSAATVIQAWIRMCLAKKRLRQLKSAKIVSENLAKQDAAVVIQKHFRSLLARRCVSGMRAERMLVGDSERNVDGVQQAGEGESNEDASDDVFDDTQKATPTASTAPDKKNDVFDMDKVLKLHQDVRKNERLQKICSNILEACERKLSEEHVPQVDSDKQAKVLPKQERRNGSPSPHSVLSEEGSHAMPSPSTQNKAAVKLQAWYRGCRERIRLHKHLQERRDYMNAYRGNVAVEEPSEFVDNVALSSRPVYAKIQDAVDMLFDSKMYISKVGAFILNRLSALSPHFCAYLVIDAQGLVAILDIFEQKTTGRGPAAAEILVILQEVFLRIVECTHPSVRAEVDAHVADCVKISLHIFHAFYKNPAIVYGFGRAILALYRRPNAKAHFAKSQFYLNYASKRFARLPETDPRKAVLQEMRSEMLSS